MAKKLELFKFDACPFCQMVMNHMESLNLKFEYKDIMEDQANLSRLMNDTGRRTVPCLYIDNQPMFESRDIMAWVDENIDQLDKK